MKRFLFVLALSLFTIVGRAVSVGHLCGLVSEKTTTEVLPAQEFYIDLLTYETRSQTYQNTIDLPARFYVKVVGQQVEFCLPTFSSMDGEQLLDDKYTVSYSGKVEQFKSERDKKGVQHISFCFRNKSHKEKIHISIFSDSRVFVEWESATNQWNGGSFTGTMR